MTHYPTDLTENQWQVIKKILSPQERERKHSLSTHSIIQTARKNNRDPFAALAALAKR